MCLLFALSDAASSGRVLLLQGGSATEQNSTLALGYADAVSLHFFAETKAALLHKSCAGPKQKIGFGGRVGFCLCRSDANDGDRDWQPSE